MTYARMVQSLHPLYITVSSLCNNNCIITNHTGIQRCYHTHITLQQRTCTAHTLSTHRTVPNTHSPGHASNSSFKNTALLVLLTLTANSAFIIYTFSSFTNSFIFFSLSLFVFPLLKLRETSSCNNICVINVTESFSLLNIKVRAFWSFPSTHVWLHLSFLPSSLTLTFIL